MYSLLKFLDLSGTVNSLCEVTSVQIVLLEARMTDVLGVLIYLKDDRL